MTSRFAVMEYLENKSVSWKERAKLDIYIGLVARALGPGKEDENGKCSLTIP